MRSFPAIAILACALSLSACVTTGTGRLSDAQSGPIAAAPTPAPRSAIEDILAKQAAAGAKSDPVAAFYQSRDYAPAWTGGKQEEEGAQAARAVLARAAEQGLRAEDYDSGNDCGDAATCDIALSEAVLGYAHDVRVGRVRPQSVYQDVDLPAPRFDAAAELSQALASHALPDWLAALPPSHPEYLGLVQALAKYRGIVEQGGWPALPGGKEINPGGKDRGAVLLAKRLAFEDPILAAIAKPSPAQVREAVKRFQARNGLDKDGRARGKTLAALNVPASFRVQQIAANMERWRWMPARFEDRAIAVNVPDQSLAFIADGQAVLKSRVVVGQKASPTPILRTAVIAAVVNPPWNIPGDIAAKALLPHLRRDPGYLASRHMVVMDGPPGDPIGRTIKWRKIVPDEFPYAIRQLPGPATALGALMLDSPNDFDVYLHDTPNKKLFDLDSREISNGCVRVQQIFPLASLALGPDQAQAMSELTAARNSHQTQRLALDQPLPVYLLYWTALGDADGDAGFRPDLYGRDAPLIAALAKQEPPSAQASGAEASKLGE